MTLTYPGLNTYSEAVIQKVLKSGVKYKSQGTSIYKRCSAMVGLFQGLFKVKLKFKNKKNFGANRLFFCGRDMLWMFLSVFIIPKFT